MIKLFLKVYPLRASTGLNLLAWIDGINPNNVPIKNEKVIAETIKGIFNSTLIILKPKALFAREAAPNDSPTPIKTPKIPPTKPNNNSYNNS